MKLFHNPHSRATIAHWMLDECGADYELVHVSIDDKEHKTAAFLAMNPAGKLPTLLVDDTPIYENVAICLYLADRYPEAGLAPAIDDPQRGRYLALSVFTTSQLEPAMVDALIQREHSTAAGWNALPTVIEGLTQELGDGPWLLGDRFSTADLLIGASLAWYLRFGGKLPDALTDFVARATARPAAAAIRTTS